MRNSLTIGAFEENPSAERHLQQFWQHVGPLLIAAVSVLQRQGKQRGLQGW